MFLCMERNEKTPERITYMLYSLAAVYGFQLFRWLLNFWDNNFKFSVVWIVLIAAPLLWVQYFKYSKRVNYYFTYVRSQPESEEYTESYYGEAYPYQPTLLQTTDDFTALETPEPIPEASDTSDNQI